ncbi:hypothetical protein DFH27DRAFT_549105 [Peziza echinospora]|nr:hypothetical protein DFH27DRAFT_549105 [Peziza echinospora]
MSIASSASSIILSPFHLLIWAIRNFSNVLLFLLSPFFIVIYYASYVLTPVVIPFRILANLESAYIFCGTAAVIGISVGCFLALTNTVLFNALSLSSPAKSSRSRSSSDIDGETLVGIKRLRDERRRQRAGRRDIPAGIKGKGPQYPKPSDGLASPTKPKPITTIMEEEDEEEYRTSLPQSSGKPLFRASASSRPTRNSINDSDRSFDS